MRMTFIRNKFDFEIGYFIKSPCKECEKWDSFPNCLDNCALLDKIHAILAEGISCNYSRAE